jgi:hypothetical protein
VATAASVSRHNPAEAQPMVEPKRYWLHEIKARDGADVNAEYMLASDYDALLELCKLVTPWNDWSEYQDWHDKFNSLTTSDKEVKQ